MVSGLLFIAAGIFHFATEYSERHGLSGRRYLARRAETLWIMGMRAVYAELACIVGFVFTTVFLTSFFLTLAQAQS